MAVWRTIRVERGRTCWYIFPAGRMDTEWIFRQFPKIQKTKGRYSNEVQIECNDQLYLVWEAILSHLEENGWEPYAASPDNDFTAFKRKED